MITAANLDELYEAIANSTDAPETVSFQGVIYKTGSQELKAAIQKWREEHNLPNPQ